MDHSVLVACALAMAGAGCLPSPTFHCAASADCGTNGMCQPDGLCSFADPSCSSGERYGSLAGNQSNQCVGAGMAVDARTFLDAPIDAPPCQGYTALSGVTGNVYQAITAASWDTAIAQCQGMAGGFLAVPAAQNEQTAILAATGTDTWMGIRQTGNGVFTTQNGSTPFLPWAAGQPSGNGQTACVLAHGSDGSDQLARCSDVHAAMCECVP